MNSKVVNLDSEQVVKAIEAALDQLQSEHVNTTPQDECEEQEDSEQEDDSISQN